MIEYRPSDNEDAVRKQQEMEQRYRNVFGTPEGRIVLGHILSENHYGVPLNTEVERIEYNVGITIARMCGAAREIDAILGIKGE